MFQSIGTIMWIPLFSDIANYKKEMHIVKYNRRGDGHAMSLPLRTTGRDANRFCFKGTLSVHALNYVTSLVTLRLA